MKVVETALGVQLFERTNRGVELTAAGETFVQEARRALTAADRVARRAQAAARGEVGTLRLAYTLATVYENGIVPVPEMAVRSFVVGVGMGVNVLPVQCRTVPAAPTIHAS